MRTYTAASVGTEVVGSGWMGQITFLEEHDDTSQYLVGVWCGCTTAFIIWKKQVYSIEMQANHDHQLQLKQKWQTRTSCFFTRSGSLPALC